MKNIKFGYLLTMGVALLVLIAPGCEKFHDNFPSGPSADSPQSDPMPSGLTGTWISKYAVVNDQQVSVREFVDDYLGRNVASIKLQFSSNGDFSEYVLDPNDSTLWYVQGNSVFQGENITLTYTRYNGERSPGGKIIDAWSLNGNQLILTDRPSGGVSINSVIYEKE